jgi:urease accessory protein UreF
VSPVECSSATPIAIQMAGLLCESDRAELEEILRRWIAEAPTAALRRQYQRFGAKLLELKQALGEMPVVPTRRELEFQLTLMLQLAASSPEPARG